MTTRLTITGLALVMSLLLPALGHGAKAPHMEKEVVGPIVFVRPEIQDLGTTITPIRKLVFHEEFNSSDTSLTLNLSHQKGSAVSGTARFAATDAFDSISMTFQVVGRTKLKKQKISAEDGSTTKVVVPSFSLKGSTLFQGTSITLAVKAHQLSFNAADTPTTQAISVAGYEYDVRINGLPNKFRYTAESNVRGRFNFGFQLAPDSAGGKKKPSVKYDLYHIWTVGILNSEIGKGIFRKIDNDGIFTLKARKIKLTATDFDYAAPFDADYIKLKTPVGRFTGDPDQVLLP